MEEKKQSWLANLVTKRATVMTPILILHVIVLTFSTIIFFKKGDYFVFIPWLLILLYTIPRHEDWARKAPWLLAPQQIALRGLELFGTNKERLKVENVADLEPVNNPEMNQIEAPKKKGKKQ